MILRYLIFYNLLLSFSQCNLVCLSHLEFIVVYLLALVFHPVMNTKDSLLQLGRGGNSLLFPFHTFFSSFCFIFSLQQTNLGHAVSTRPAPLPSAMPSSPVSGLLIRLHYKSHALLPFIAEVQHKNFAMHFLLRFTLQVRAVLGPTALRNVDHRPFSKWKLLSMQIFSLLKWMTAESVCWFACWEFLLVCNKDGFITK